VLFAMARDGLLPRRFASIDPATRTPGFATTVAGACVAVLAGLFPIDLLVQLVSLGTLSVFMAVCVGVLILRRTRADLVRPFRAPFSPVLPLLGAAVCLYLLAGLPPQSWALYGGWTLAGLLIYLGFGRRSARR
jgi:APA family basic amino acid/polyamine antiporter